jgi:hypothetical protein
MKHLIDLEASATYIAVEGKSADGSLKMDELLLGFSVHVKGEDSTQAVFVVETNLN